MRELKEFGVAQSSRVIDEARTCNVAIARVARGFTYTTRDDRFPSTDLTIDNPFADDIISAKNILDFGCGVGRNLPWIYENTNATYYGLDPNPVMLDNFWNVTDEKYADRVVLLKSFDDIPDGVWFDVIVSTFVLQHLGYSKTPEGAMDLTDMTQEIFKHSQIGTVWYLLEHEREGKWVMRWLTENDLYPTVSIENYEGQPDLLDRGKDLQLVILQETKLNRGAQRDRKYTS